MDDDGVSRDLGERSLHGVGGDAAAELEDGRTAHVVYSALSFT
jgi:hypothetical protein